MVLQRCAFADVAIARTKLDQPGRFFLVRNLEHNRLGPGTPIRARDQGEDPRRARRSLQCPPPKLGQLRRQAVLLLLGTPYPPPRCGAPKGALFA